MIGKKTVIVDVLKHREADFSRTVPDDAMITPGPPTAIRQVSSSALSPTTSMSGEADDLAQTPVLAVHAACYPCGRHTLVVAAKFAAPDGRHIAPPRTRGA